MCVERLHIVSVQNAIVGFLEQCSD
jgi:hypothetical protein